MEPTFEQRVLFNIGAACFWGEQFWRGQETEKQFRVSKGKKNAVGRVCVRNVPLLFRIETKNIGMKTKEVLAFVKHI